jgi:WhiB family transcriptional regulator, redox-sensing transcriptional regulator
MFSNQLRNTSRKETAIKSTHIDFSWTSKSACKDSDLALFFPENNDPKVAFKIREAKSICNSCLVQKECLNYALEYEIAGVWGGMTENDRRKHRLHHRINMNRERFALQNFLPFSRVQMKGSGNDAD